MAVCAISEKEKKYLSENSVEECAFNQKFYNPLSLTGYLTPLQRKKLREKRNFLCNDVSVSKGPTNVKKPRSIKRKKEQFSNISSNEGFKRKKSKGQIPQVQCTAAKIIFRGANSNGKDKKFFKTSSPNRLERANFTMPLVFKKNVFLNIDKCVKETLLYSRKRRFHKVNSSHSFESTDLVKDVKSSNVSTPHVVTLNKENCRSILRTSASEVSASSAVEDSYSLKNESSELISDSPKERSVFDFDWPSDELLLRRQQKARAIVRKLNYLKELNNSVKQNDTVEEKQGCDVEPVKLYPIFHTIIRKQSKSNPVSKSSPKTVSKRKLDSSRGGEQMIIDAGQKEIGAKICSTCNMIYTIGQEEDENLHLNYHNMYLINLKFPGWKEENVIGNYGDGRVILVRKDDKSVKLKKIEDVLVIANRDLGFPSSSVPTKPDLTFVLFISSTRQVAGCVIAEPISSACQVLLDTGLASNDHLSPPKNSAWKIGNWYSSSKQVPAICGINRIWVAHSFRRHKVASRMIDCLRCHFIHGHVIGIRELAFTDPSPDGRAFAAAYTGTDKFLVYK